MILPIHTYGEPVLRQEAIDVEQNTDSLQQLIDDMFETMHGAAGVGLAAPQVGRTERLFVVDLSALQEDPEAGAESVPREPMVFINPEIVWESEEMCEYEEGCLSIPDLRDNVIRPERIRLRYLDRNMQPQELETGDYLARVIQHEYDHLEGILFVDRLSPLRRRLLRRRLRDIARGEVEADYPLAPHTS